MSSTTGETGASIPMPSMSSGFSPTLTTLSPASNSGVANPSASTGAPSSTSPSTPLYLYTFLAALLLLLSISSAIILRSLVLRRRHRQMIQEAIRDGTWFPSPAGGAGAFVLRGRSSRKKVDPRKKPKIWEAVMDLKGAVVSVKLDWDWDSIQPFSVTAVEVPHSEPAEPAPVNYEPEPMATTESSSPRDRLSFVQRIRRFFNPAPSPPSLPLPEPSTSNNNTNDSSPDLSETTFHSGMHSVRVAVFIAMPSPSTSQSSSQLHIDSASHSSTSPIQLPLESSSLGQPRPQSPPFEGKGTKEFPHFEIGTADFGIRHDKDSANVVDGQVETKSNTSLRSSADSVDTA